MFLFCFSFMKKEPIQLAQNWPKMRNYKCLLLLYFPFFKIIATSIIMYCSIAKYDQVSLEKKKEEKNTNKQKYIYITPLFFCLF